jgi:hypothetical protein
VLVGRLEMPQEERRLSRGLQADEDHEVRHEPEAKGEWLRV